MKKINIGTRVQKRVLGVGKHATLNCPDCHLRIARVETEADAHGPMVTLRFCCTNSKCNWKSQWIRCPILSEVDA